MSQFMFVDEAGMIDVRLLRAVELCETTDDSKTPYHIVSTYGIGLNVQSHTLRYATREGRDKAYDRMVTLYQVFRNLPDGEGEDDDPGDDAIDWDHEAEDLDD